MFISPAELLVILEKYRYWIIFPIAIFEGPIIIIISGFLVKLGYLNGLIAYTVVVVADIIGDSIYYSIGRFWGTSKFVKKLGSFVGYDDSTEKFLEEHFKKHKMKTFMIGKVSHGLGGSVQIASGIGKVSYGEFVWLSLLGTVPKTIVLILIGYFLGTYYERIDDYLHNIALVTISIFLVFLLVIIGNKIKTNFLNSKE